MFTDGASISNVCVCAVYLHKTFNRGGGSSWRHEIVRVNKVVNLLNTADAYGTYVVLPANLSLPF